MIKKSLVLIGLMSACGSALGQSEYEGMEPLSVWRQARLMQLDYVAHLKQQLAADPDNLARQLDLGRAYFGLALQREGAALFEAEKIFEQILARDPTSAVALAYHGSLLGLKIGYNFVPQEQIMATGKQAFEELNRAVALAPNSIEVREARGYSSFYTPSFLGRDPLAVEDFTHVIRLLERRPGTEEHRAEVYLILGDTYKKMGDWAKAQTSWQRASQWLPGSSPALGAEARLRDLEHQDQVAPIKVKELAAFFGFLIGVIIFARLTVLVFHDLIRTRRRRSGMLASLLVSLAALIWNGLNLLLIIFNAVGTTLPEAFRPMVAWQQQDLTLIWGLSPIPFGLITAYRFYPATFMDMVLKRGAALLVMLILSLVYARLIEIPLELTILQIPHSEALRPIFFTGLWLGVLALYWPLRNRIYHLVDHYLFKRRDYSRLLDWFNDRLRGVTAEASLIASVSDALKEAFAADSVRFVPASDEFAARVSKVLAEQKTDVTLRRHLVDDELYAELEKRRVELALAIRSSDELVGVILIGSRPYGQGYLSEELSVLRAVAAQIGRALENLRLHEIRRQQAIAEEELRKLAAQAELKALRAQIDPHFFFNALNSVAALIGDDPAAAEEVLEDIADLFRQAFKPSREVVSLKEELDLVETYLKVEKVRLGDKLRFKKVVPPDALSVRIPGLIIQSLIENAVKHGIGRSNNGGSITLSAAVKDGYLNVVVADTGAGIPPSELSHVFSRGVGLANVNDRLVRLYGPGARPHIDSVPEQGTTVSFAIPLAEQKTEAGIGQSPPLSDSIKSAPMEPIN